MSVWTLYNENDPSTFPPIKKLVLCDDGVRFFLRELNFDGGYYWYDENNDYDDGEYEDMYWMLIPERT